MPQPVRLRAQRIDQIGMGVPQRVHGNASGKIEIALAVGHDEPGPFASFEGEVDTGIGRQQVRGHDTGSLVSSAARIHELFTKRSLSA